MRPAPQQAAGKAAPHCSLPEHPSALGQCHLPRVTPSKSRPSLLAGNSNQWVSSQSRITREKHTPWNFPEHSQPALVAKVSRQGSESKKGPGCAPGRAITLRPKQGCSREVHHDARNTRVKLSLAVCVQETQSKAPTRCATPTPGRPTKCRAGLHPPPCARDAGAFNSRHL